MPPFGTRSYGIGCLFQDALSREDARGVAGAASATPKFGTLLNKLGSDILLHFFIYCLLHHFKIPTVLPTLSWVGVLFTTYLGTILVFFSKNRKKMQTQPRRYNNLEATMLQWRLKIYV